MAGAFFDVSCVLTFVADDLDHADEKLDELLEFLEEKGFEANGTISIEESLALNE